MIIPAAETSYFEGIVQENTRNPTLANAKTTQLAKELYLLGKINHIVMQSNGNSSWTAFIKQMKRNCLERTKSAKPKLQFYCMNP